MTIRVIRGQRPSPKLNVRNLLFPNISSSLGLLITFPGFTRTDVGKYASLVLINEAITPECRKDFRWLSLFSSAACLEPLSALPRNHSATTNDISLPALPETRLTEAPIVPAARRGLGLPKGWR